MLIYLEIYSKLFYNLTKGVESDVEDKTNF